MMTYASNKDGNSIMVDAQEWERKEKQIDRLYSLLETKDDTIHQLNDLVKRQRVIIEMYNEAAIHLLDAPPGFYFDGDWDELSIAYAAAQDTTSMTGASEK